MSIRNLHALFNPKSVAVIGASGRAHSVGATVLQNLIDGAFKGPIYPVNPKYDTLCGLPVFASVDDLPGAPDLAVICTPPSVIPDLISALGARGTRAAIVLTAGLNAITDDAGISIKQRMLSAAKPNLLRILGPNCVGLLVPGIGLNASFAHTDALPGKLAFVSQSGALVTGVLDWAKSRGIGFSKFISLGDSADVDFGDVLDYLASDAETHAILLYIEDIRHARKFMSAARAAARGKPVLVLKAGRVAEGARAAASHTGALAGSDDVYDAAIRRAGMLRVCSTGDLFSAVQTLAHAKSMIGERLTILTNGGGPGVMATDALVGAGGKLATVSEDSINALQAILPATWSQANPIDIIGDASATRYVDALKIVLNDAQSDAVLLLHAPTAIVPSIDIARAIAPVAQASARNVLTCWLGGAAVAPSRTLFAEAGMASYDTPEDAVNGFMQIVQYHRNQHLLMQVPTSVPTDFVPDRVTARAVLHEALAAGRDMLSEPEAKMLLAAYAIPVVATRIAETAEQAVLLAQQIGFPVALKILSPQISHKTEVGGVALDLETADAVDAAAQAMQKRLQTLRPDATLRGFVVQAMARRPDAQELIIGVSTDPIFGPVILFGQGGIAVEVMDDNTIGLPPLNRMLARDMISRTRVARLLAGYRNKPAANIDAICDALIQVAHLVADCPQIIELDINPLLADADGVMALDARVRIAASGTISGVERFAIRPYPAELEQVVVWQGQSLMLRPIRPEDAAAHQAFFDALDAEDIRLRVFIGMRELQPAQLARLTQIDYDRAMAFIATRKHSDGQPETLGVVRVIADPDNEQAEFAVIIRSDLKGQGLGSLLTAKVIAYCRERGTGEIIGEALPQNSGVLNLLRRFGFDLIPMPDDGVVMFRLKLR